MKIKIFLTSSIVCLMASIQHVQADPYAACSQILKDGAFNTSVSSSNKNYQSIFRDYLCSQEARNEKNGSKFDSAANFLSLGLSGDANFDTSKFSSWKESSCRFTSEQIDESASAFRYSQVADPTIVKAWKDCVSENSDGLACWAEPVGQNNVIIVLKSPVGDQNGVKDLTTSTLNIAVKDLPDSIDEGKEYPVIGSLQSIEEDSIFLAFGTGDISQATCKVTIPARVPDPELVSFEFSRQGSSAFDFIAKFSEPISIATAEWRVAGKLMSFEQNNTSRKANFLTGSQTFSYRGNWTKQNWDGWYWQCAPACGENGACTGGCQEKLAKEYENQQRVHNNAIREFLDSARRSTIQIVDTNGNSYLGVANISD